MESWDVLFPCYRFCQVFSRTAWHAVFRIRIRIQPKIWFLKVKTAQLLKKVDLKEQDLRVMSKEIIWNIHISSNLLMFFCSSYFLLMCFKYPDPDPESHWMQNRNIVGMAIFCTLILFRWNFARFPSRTDSLIRIFLHRYLLFSLKQYFWLLLYLFLQVQQILFFHSFF